MRYQGYAYKIYKPSYRPDWIRFEMRQQEVVNEAGLTPVRYYATDDDHIVRMDLIEIGGSFFFRKPPGTKYCNRTGSSVVLLTEYETVRIEMRAVNEKDENRKWRR